MISFCLKSICHKEEIYKEEIYKSEESVPRALASGAFLAEVAGDEATLLSVLHSIKMFDIDDAYLDRNA